LHERRRVPEELREGGRRDAARTGAAGAQRGAGEPDGERARDADERDGDRQREPARERGSRVADDGEVEGCEERRDDLSAPA
jgi:hypothetical protein